MILARKFKKIQGFSSDFRYVEAFSGHSVKFRQNLMTLQRKSSRKLQNFESFLTVLFEILWKNAKIRDENFLKYWGLSGAQACKSCRSRQELSNEYLLAKIGFDTAENESLKVCQELDS